MAALEVSHLRLVSCLDECIETGLDEMGYASGLHREVLFTIGLVLFAFIMIINVSLTRILKKGVSKDDK